MCKHNGIMAFLCGAAAGAVVALLFAPEKGEVTRRKIGDAVDRGKDAMMDAVEKGKYKIEDALMAGRDRMEDALMAGKEKAEGMIRAGKKKIENEVSMFCDEAQKMKSE